jgi:catechol 2,3-dioxygenase-like lactoylglutathione lyase family enzyme
MNTENIITPELKVFNIKESLDFYTKLAGFEILYDRPENKFAMLTINGARLMLEELTDDSRAYKVGKLEKPLGRGMHFQIMITDVQGLYDNFKKNNYPIFIEMDEKWYRVNDTEKGHKQFRVQDPDGYQLRFCEDLGSRPAKS